MSSVPFGFSSWRRRSASLSSRETPRDADTLTAFPIPGSIYLVRSAAPDMQHLSTSFNSTPIRGPMRSYLHGTVREHLAPIDSIENARSVRQDTAELASYFLADQPGRQNPGFIARRTSVSSYGSRDVLHPLEHEWSHSDVADARSETIPEEREPSSPEPELDVDVEADIETDRPSTSLLTSLLRQSVPAGQSRPEVLESTPRPSQDEASPGLRLLPDLLRSRSVPSPSPSPAPDETSPLLITKSTHYPPGAPLRTTSDVEAQKEVGKGNWLGRALRKARSTGTGATQYDGHFAWQKILLAPLSCMPAVMVGLLLNILDALSYGMILFPLGKSIFSHLGPAGISIFYVSTIISQITFSAGSIFKGGIGSELIEVVPFFHSMALTITDIVGEENPDAVIATTIVSYAASSMVTGMVFYLMGKFKFGYMVGFIPRHILIGCIGGVGFFLIVTGFEVSARLDGNLTYDLETLRQLSRPETLPLWLIPFVLAMILFHFHSRVESKYFVPTFILSIPLAFYAVVLALGTSSLDSLRGHGWIFEGPPPDEPWWYFYTLYQFHLVHWNAVAQTVPAMFALTFFGILHVPINVPALALNTGEDNVDLDRELKLHGYSNLLSGMAGSIQNYLVYANTLFFMRSGGDSRLAGFILAGMTGVVMVIGPSIIGFIPVMMVGTLIFDLGFELLLEAVWLPRKKLKVPEYLTVIVIVLVMGVYDFVIGIGVGILLAFAALTFQTSRVSAIRATYSGDIVTSTVRRNPSQHHYLQNVGQQIHIIKLSGFLFFGTIVSVEAHIRALIEDSAFGARPIKYLVMDLWQVSGLDYSAGEAFNTISRLLDDKGIVLILSGVEPDSNLGQTLRAVGVGSDGGIEVILLPDLNSALESCENELLKAFYAQQAVIQSSREPPATASLDVRTGPRQGDGAGDAPVNTPRRTYLQETALQLLQATEVQRPNRWHGFKEPLRLMLQIFQDLSDKNEDFWFRAVPFFVRQEVVAGGELFKRGEDSDGFYLIEKGILRAEYDLPQGRLCESLVAGTTCGELPFFSETCRTATVTAERDSTLWRMDRERWHKLQAEEPDVSHEILRISLKLTSERMASITSYILTMAK